MKTSCSDDPFAGVQILTRAVEGAAHAAGGARRELDCCLTRGGCSLPAQVRPFITWVLSEGRAGKRISSGFRVVVFFAHDLLQELFSLSANMPASAVPKPDSEIHPTLSAPVSARSSGVRPIESRAPSVTESILLWLIAAMVFILVITRFQSFWHMVETFADNKAYIGAAKAVLSRFGSYADIKQFWGLPYLIAGLSLFHVPLRYGFLFVCTGSSLASMLLARKLWGEWVALFFALLNITWIQASYLGGSEPLFVLLLFLSFWQSRKGHWMSAAVLAALATVVRPLGFLALVGIGLTLLLRKEIWKAAACTGVAALIGLLYLLPFWIYLHDPLFQVHHYKQEDWHGGWPVGWPFHGIVASLIHNREPWTNVILTTGWIAFAVVGFCAMIAKLRQPRLLLQSGDTKGWRSLVKERPAEYLFAFSYLIFLFCYDSQWVRAEFPRFAIPVAPFLLVALERRLPKRRFVVYPLAVVSAVLGAASAVGLRNVMAALHS